MNFTPANRGPQSEAPSEKPAVTYKPARMSPSMAASTAPIPGAGEPVRVRGVAQPQPQEPQGEPDQGDAEEEGTPDEIAQRADLTKRLALLADKDRRIRQRQKQAAEMEARIKAREEEFAAREARIKEWEAQDAERKRNPRKALMDYGFSPEAALQFELNKGQLTPEQQAALKLDETLAAERQRTAAELQAIRDEQARVLKEREEQEAKAAQEAEAEQERAAIEELHTEIGDVLQADGEAFPLLTMSGDNASAVVFARIQELSDQHFEKTGRRPPVTTRLIEQAAKQVEADARKELEQANEKLGFRPQQIPRRPQTLTNGAPKRPAQGQPPQQETEAEKRARVLAAIDRAHGRGGR